MLFQCPIPARYDTYSSDELGKRIGLRKQELGDRLVILGHHYQEDEVIRYADFTGDSLKLSELAAQQDKAEFVVFCGVHFMAESADILTDNSVSVVLPDLSAGCSMADMADIGQLEDAWDFLTGETDAVIIPITYVNSAAAIKAFCGRHGGACCTSSNAQPILEWALTRGDKVIFLPDQHLGRNTAYALGFSLDDMLLFDPGKPDGGLTGRQVQEAKFFLWKGHCSVHQLFTAHDVDEIRRSEPDRSIIVHPECSWEVVQKADQVGSTEFIISAVRNSPAGSKWAVGTEIHLVNRLSKEQSDKSIRSLSRVQCLCTTMYRIDSKHLLYVLDALADGQIVNRISVSPAIKRDAVEALNRMLSATPSGSTSVQNCGAKPILN